MADEPDNLVLKLLREMRGELEYLRDRADETNGELKTLRKEIHDWQETTATATGFALHANVRGQAFEEQLVDLRKRVEVLEKAK